MKVLFDHQIFSQQKFGGISRYFYELMKEFNSLSSIINYELSIIHTDNEYIKKIKDFETYVSEIDKAYKNFITPKEFTGKGRIFNTINRYNKIQNTSIDERNKNFSILKLKEGDFDIFHATYYDDYFLEFIGNKPFVVTVYDLIHQIFPEYFPLDGVDKNSNILEKASKIIAISESTKRDLISFYDIPEEKIEVTYLACSINDEINISHQFKNKIPQKYILFVGQRSIYKNFYFFAEAYAKVCIKFPDIKLVCTGNKFSESELAFFYKLQISNKVYQFFVSDDELIYLYKNALAFVFPSIYEGFGIPILEAFENKCPVLLANNSSLKEIAGDAALFFETKNFSSICENLEKIISDKNLKTELVEKGIIRVKDFSWNKTAIQTFQIYKSSINNNV